MKNFHICIALFVLLTLGAVSCDKEDSDQPTNQATLEISSPVEGSSFATGDTIHIHAQATATQDLHGYQINITDVANNHVIYTTEEHAHGKSLEILQMWPNNTTSGTSLKISIVVTLDHDGHYIEKSVNVQSN